MGLAGAVKVFPGTLPVGVLDGKAAGFGEAVRGVATLPIDGNPVAGFDGEAGHADLLKRKEPGTGPGSWVAWRWRRLVAEPPGRPSLTVIGGAHGLGEIDGVAVDRDRIADRRFVDDSHQADGAGFDYD